MGSWLSQFDAGGLTTPRQVRPRFDCFFPPTSSYRLGTTEPSNGQPYLDLIYSVIYRCSSVPSLLPEQIQTLGSQAQVSCSLLSSSWKEATFKYVIKYTPFWLRAFCFSLIQIRLQANTLISCSYRSTNGIHYRTITCTRCPFTRGFHYVNWLE